MKQAERIQIPGINPKLAEELSRHAIHLNKIEATTSNVQAQINSIQNNPPGGGQSGDVDGGTFN